MSVAVSSTTSWSSAAASRLLVETELGADARDADGMLDERRAGAARLSLVRGRREMERPRDEIAVDGAPVRPDLGEQLVEETLVPFACLQRRHLPSVLPASAGTSPAGTTLPAPKSSAPCTVRAAEKPVRRHSSRASSSRSTSRLEPSGRRPGGRVALAARRPLNYRVNGGVYDDASLRKVGRGIENGDLERRVVERLGRRQQAELVGSDEAEAAVVLRVPLEEEDRLAARAHGVEGSADERGAVTACPGTPAGRRAARAGGPARRNLRRCSSVFITWPTTRSSSSATNASSGTYHSLAQSSSTRRGTSVVAEGSAVDREDRVVVVRRRGADHAARASGGTSSSARKRSDSSGCRRPSPSSISSSTKIAVASTSRAAAGLRYSATSQSRSSSARGHAVKMRRTTSCGATVPFQRFSSSRNATS